VVFDSRCDLQSFYLFVVTPHCLRRPMLASKNVIPNSQFLFSCVLSHGIFFPC